MTLIKPQIVEDLAHAHSYCANGITGVGKPREAEAIVVGHSLDKLEAIAQAHPGLRIFVTIISYAEGILKVGVDRIVQESLELLRAHLGQLPLYRVLWRVYIHTRGKLGCDGHLLGIPLDLLTGKVLPLIPRDKLAVAINEKLPRLWDLELDRANPLDWFRLDLRPVEPAGLPRSELNWLRDTYALLADGLRAGLYANYADMLQALRDAGATIIQSYYHHIVIEHENHQYPLWGTLFSQRFPHHAVSGSAGKILERDPATSAIEAASLRKEVAPLLAGRAKTFERFTRFAHVRGAPGFSPGVVEHLRPDDEVVGGLARTNGAERGSRDPGVVGCKHTDSQGLAASDHCRGGRHPDSGIGGHSDLLLPPAPRQPTGVAPENAGGAGGRASADQNRPGSLSGAVRKTGLAGPFGRTNHGDNPSDVPTTLNAAKATADRIVAPSTANPGMAAGSDDDPWYIHFLTAEEEQQKNENERKQRIRTLIECIVRIARRLADSLNDTRHALGRHGVGDHKVARGSRDVEGQGGRAEHVEPQTRASFADRFAEHTAARACLAREIDAALTPTPRLAVVRRLDPPQSAHMEVGR